MISDTLDLTSSAFDPKEVLTSSEVILPCPNAKVYSNLAEYEVRVLKGRKPLRRATTNNENPKLPTDKDKSTVTNRSLDQPSIPTSSKLDKTNVLIRMETAFNKGPLRILNQCVQQRIRVKVSIRNYGDIRGTCTGFIVAFDKHWNLAMRDVDETYIKRKILKTPVLKILSKECYRTVVMCESSELAMAQPSISACCQEDSEAYDTVSDTDTTNTISLESCSTENLEIPEKITGNNELSVLKTSDLLQESITRLNLEESECSNKIEGNASFEEKDISSEKGNLKYGEDTSVSSITKAIKGNAGSEIMLKHHRRKRKQPKICQRHVNQLFIRGDNVVLVKLLP